MFQKEFKVKRILPLVEVDGLLFVTNSRIYFQPYHNLYGEQVLNFKIKNFSEFFKRRFKLTETGLQLIVSKKNTKQQTLYLNFGDETARNAVHDAIVPYLPGACKTEITSISDYTYDWVNGKLSNFDYLTIVNTYAQRSTQDLTQYPVFPWILSDYKTDVLDLQDEKNFRDLSKPMGALNEKRLADFKSRYAELPEEERYLYGTHYSCPGYVIGYLVRSNPQWMIKF